jgi:ABC-type lipoprotein release transport system permease subunit
LKYLRVAWLSIAGATFGVVAVSALAAFFPARHAAGLMIADALEHE